MSPTNVPLICSDQHARNALGCYGHPLVRTPNLDALAAAGTRFTAAYSSSPICVPAQAFADQRVRLEALRGEAVIRAQGDLGNEWAYASPPEIHATR